MIDPDLEEKPITLKTLHSAVTKLTEVVAALDETLKRDYPTRRDIAKRRWQFAGAVLLAITASYFCTIGTISYCFLDGIPNEGDKPFCQMLPGWEKSFDNNRHAQQTFEELIKKTAENDARLDKLESK